MSELPLSAPAPHTVAICSPSLSAAQAEVKQYNNVPGVTVLYVLTKADAYAVPTDTPWCRIGGEGSELLNVMRSRLGPEKTAAEAFNVWNNEYAISPKLLKP